MTFLVRLTRSNFSREVGDIFLPTLHIMPIDSGLMNSRTESRQGTRNAKKFFMLELVFVGRCCLAVYPGVFSGRARTRCIRSGTSDSNRCSPRDSGSRCSPADACPSGDGFSLFSLLPERRVEIRFGKFSLADFFDTNTYGTDTTLQFHELDRG